MAATFGERLQELIDRKGISRRAFSHAMKFPERMTTHIVNNKRSPPIDDAVLERWANYLDVPEDQRPDFIVAAKDQRVGRKQDVVHYVIEIKRELASTKRDLAALRKENEALAAELRRYEELLESHPELLRAARASTGHAKRGSGRGRQRGGG